MRKAICLTCSFLPAFISLYAQTPSYPFPQHVTYTAGTIRPNAEPQAEMDDSVGTFYDVWKSRYLINGCDTDEYYVYFNLEGYSEPGNAICVSEGQGYGMLITALMAGYDADAKKEFDGLFRYVKNHPSIIDHGLMAWEQLVGCNSVADGDAATDGDLDIAYSLLLADAQWGSDGDIHYLQEAKNTITAIYNSEINHNNQAVKLGDWSDGSSSAGSYSTRPSDFMPDHFRLFSAAMDDANWQLVVDRCYTVINQIQMGFSPLTGLVPDFVVNTNTSAEPAPANFLEGATDSTYNYNSCRVPWRIATDYLVNDESRSYDALTPLNAWIRASSSDDPDQIKSGYALSGAPLPGSNYSDLSFIAPFGVSAMIDPVNQDWLNTLWDYILSVPPDRDGYFGNSIKIISIIVMSGNWWVPDTAAFNGINMPVAQEQINIFPNPVPDVLHLNIPFAADIQVFNTLGEKVLEQHNSGEINAGSLSDGMYFLLIRNNGVVYHSTFIKGR